MDIKYLYVDSTSRDQTLYPSGNAYTLHLTDQVRNIHRVDLVSAHVPNSYFNIENGSNVMTFQSDTNQVNFNFDPGFYSASGLQAEISCRLPQFTNVAYLTNEGKFLFLSPVPFTLSIHQDEFSRRIGFPIGTYTATGSWLDPALSQVNIGAFFVRSPNVVDFSKNEFVFLDVQEFRTPTSIQAVALNRDGTGTFSGSSSRNSFGFIPMNVPSGSIKCFSESGDFAVSIEFPQPIEKLSRLTVSWVDRNGQPINFQGHNSNSFLLRFHIVKKKEQPPVPAVDEFELKRILESMTLAQIPEEEPKKQFLGKWTIYLILIFGVVGYIVYKTFIRPNAPGPS